MAKERDAAKVHHPHEGRSLTLYTLIDKLVQRGWRDDPAWQNKWRKAVSENSGRFAEFLKRYNAQKHEEVLGTIKPERKHWSRLLNLDVKTGDNVSKYLLNPTTHKEGDLLKESYDGLSFKQIRDTSELLSTYFGYVTRLPVFEDPESWTRVLAEALERVTADLDGGHTANDHWLPSSNVEIRTPPSFTGRDDALAAIDTAFERDDNRVVIATLHGIRGVGKTLVAATYAHEHRGDYRATWWISATTDQTIRAGLLSLGVRLRWVTSDVGEEIAVASVINRLADTADDVLLIFDDAIDPKALLPYLPKAGCCRILVTSNSDVWREHAAIIDINVWPNQTAADFLIARTGGSQSHTEAERLATEFGGLPLALEMAAAYCETKGIGFAEFRNRLDGQKVQFLADKKYAPRGYNEGLSVAATFELAIDAATGLHPAAELLLVCSALLAPEPVPLFIFSEVQDVYGEPLGSGIAAGELDDIIAALRKFSLVTRERPPDGGDLSPPNDVLRIHQLISEVVVARHSDTQLEQLRREVFVGIFRTFPDDGNVNPKSWPRCGQLSAPVFLMRNSAPHTFSNAEEWGLLLDKLANYFRGRGNYGFAENLLREAASMLEAVVGKGHLATGNAYNSLSHVLRQKGNFSEAYELMERVRAIGEPVWGPEHPSLIVTIESLGSLLRHLGRLSEALPMLRRALEMSEKTNGQDDFATGRCAGSLAGLLQQIGDDGEAIQLYQREEAIIRAAHGADSLALATCHTNIGNIYLKNGMMMGAKNRFERSLIITEDAFGEFHPELTVCLGNLGLLGIFQGRYADADILLDRAVAISDYFYGPTHITTVRLLENLAFLYYRRGDAKWRPRSLRVLRLFETSLGVDHPETARMRQGRRSMLLHWHLGRRVAGSLAVILAAGVIWFYFMK
jgi:tetratricopeptide (TPR) repeat protein